MKPELLVAVPPRPRQMEQLERDYILHRYDGLPERDGLVLLDRVGARIRGVVISGGVPFGRREFERMPALEIVASAAAGYEEIDTDFLQQRAIRFTTGSLMACDDVADMGMLLLMAARRQLLKGDDWVRSGKWEQQGMMPFTRSNVGRRLGIVGMGTIGQRIVPRARAFGQDIAYFARTPRTGVNARYEPDLVALARWADALIVIVSGGPSTRHLIGAAVLEALGPEGILVNISRGSVIDEEALIAALSTGRLAAAGLDVFACEPAPDPRLLALPNVTLMPHHASATIESRDAMDQQIIDNLAAHFAGRPLLNAVL
jgi:lactate dehydrogenase-like 2-hydroxyacid dehydrogenase